VLDCACGEGRFSRILLECGAAQVLRVDFCAPMIAAAKELATGKDTYRVADAEDLSFLSDGSFDLAVSYLNQCDLSDLAANTREVFRVLKPGGRFVVVNVHPMRSAAGPWMKTADGAKQHYILDRYFEEGDRRWRMLGAEFTNFHRTLSTYARAYREAGFTIDELIEPSPTAPNLALFPELDDELRVPNFVVFVLGKP
jgi:ubiquinone/menaquinone biosynthesis C-methylase UbiE